MRKQILTMAVLLAALAGCEKEPPIPQPTLPPEPQTSGIPASSTDAIGAVSMTSHTETEKATLPRVTADEFRKVVSGLTAEGKVVVVDVWATWCVPCIEMFPAIHDGIEKLGDDVVLVTLTLDAAADEPEAVKFLQEQHAMSNAYMMGEDVDELMKIQQVLGKEWDSLVVPAMFIYGPDDKLAGEFIIGVEARTVIDRVSAVVESWAK